MDASASFLPLAFVEGLAATPYGGVLAAGLIALMAVSVMTFSIPGALTPTAFVSGLVIGAGGVFVVAAGAVLGSHLLFTASRRWLAAPVRRRFGVRLDGVGKHLERRGPIFIATARFTGVPHILITAGAAAAPITARTFAAASLAGMLPAITLAAMAGSAI
ncbi:MAG: VTT domain-containing protein [Alteraurantiacibacter sp.]